MRWSRSGVRAASPKSDASFFKKARITGRRARTSIRHPSNYLNGQGSRKENIMGKLTNQVAVVTGASKGIGAGIAKELAAEGASVVVNYASSKDGADKVVAEITEAGGTAIGVGGSVAKAAEIDKR